MRPLIFLLIFAFIFYSEAKEPLKVLHLTFHTGCAQEVEKIAKELSLDVTTWFVPALPAYFLDPESTGNALYNIGHARAERIWLNHKDYFETFDVILTSDTAPLARIFLQNDWQKPLVVWICNRFDYSDQASLDCPFPDPEFYALFDGAKLLPHVKIVAYTAFEHYYTKLKGVDTGDLIITPFGSANLSDEVPISSIPSEITKEETFFLPPYHNETHFMDLLDKCNQLGIAAYRGHYNGPLDLKNFKGIIHLPYAWSNLALFENMQLGIPYFIPSESFMAQLILQHNYFHMNAHCLMNDNLYALSEWYCPEHRGLFTYFDSWEDLQKKIVTADYQDLRKRSEACAQEKKRLMLQRWKDLFAGF